MRILFDHQIFSEQEHGGISRYFTMLMRQLYLEGELELELSLRWSNNRYLAHNGLFTHKRFLSNVKFKGKCSLLNFLNKKVSVDSIKRNNYDIFHPTYFDPYFLDLIRNKPFVLTIHDMVYEIFPQFFSADEDTSYNKKTLAQEAERIIAVSHNTKKDIVNILGINPSKVEVIYHGISIENNTSFNRQEHFKLPEKYILFIGKRRGYKNFQNLLTALIPVLKKKNDLYLVCIGGDRFSRRETKSVDSSNIQKRILHYSVDECELSCFYRNALIMVYPSLYEGFGFPILEAFAHRTPLVVSQSSSMPEVAGDAAVYVDPCDPDSIQEGVLRVIKDASLRKKLIEEGHKRVREFSWEKAAKETKELYQSVL